MIAERVKLGDIADFINGVAFKPVDWGETGKKIIRIQNLTDPSKPYNLTKRQVASKYEVMPGDLLVSWSATLGVFVWSGPETALVNQHIFRVVPDLKRVHSAYLRHMLEDALIEMERHLHGATMQHVNRGEFLATTIPLPPLAEQKRIAEILDAADDLRMKRRESLAQLDALLQSTFLEMFGDPVTNPKGWDSATLDQVVTSGDRVNYGVVQPGDDFEGGCPLVRVGDFISGELDLSKIKFIDPAIDRRYSRSKLNGSEILISCVGSIGNICKVPEESVGYNIARAVARVPLNHSVNRDFMVQMLRTKRVQDYFLKETRTVSQPTLNISLIKSAPVLLPPLSAQREFADLVCAAERQWSFYRSQAEELDTLFASLQSRAFRGEL